MKTLKRTSLFFLSSFLMACGSSGGGSAPAFNPTPVNTTSIQLPEANTFIEQKTFKKGEVKNVDVGYGKVTGYNNKYSFSGAWMESTDDELSEIVVDGIKHKIAKSIENLGGLKGYILAEAFNSAYNVIVKDPQRDIFYFGDETALENIPKTGKFIYKGVATRYDNVSGDIGNLGTSTLTANFATKKISGELDMRYPRRNISLKETDIVGNGFNGTAIAEGNFPALISRTGKYEGKFYGPNADEVAGKAMFTGKDFLDRKDGLKDLNTSFNASKVKEEITTTKGTSAQILKLFTETPDGKEISLDLLSKGKVNIKTTDGALLGVTNNHSFYGVWRSNNYSKKIVGYQGIEATNIPTSGTATYKGDATWVSGYDSGLEKGGVTTLNVDFDNKTVNGAIKFSVWNGDEFRRDITLHKGTLSGAEFAGTASVLGNSGGQYSGALFGDGAKEAAGLVKFENNSSLDVAFGGTRD